MKTLSLLIMAFLVVYGFILCVVQHNNDGILLVVIGSLSFVIVAKKTKKIASYNPKSFMNR